VGGRAESRPCGLQPLPPAAAVGQCPADKNVTEGGSCALKCSPGAVLHGKPDASCDKGFVQWSAACARSSSCLDTLSNLCGGPAHRITISESPCMGHVCVQLSVIHIISAPKFAACLVRADGARRASVDNCLVCAGQHQVRPPCAFVHAVRIMCCGCQLSVRTGWFRRH
jgi:hypothetical protein